MLIELITAHFIADYPLQGDFLAKAKNHKNPIPNFPFMHALLAHAIIHGGFVAIITGFWWLGLFETIIHGITDFLKCDEKLTLNQDQCIHIISKIIWLIIATRLGAA